MPIKVKTKVISDDDLLNVVEELNEAPNSINDLYTSHGVKPLRIPINDNPDFDIPPCDYCKADWAGKLQCDLCKLTFYCSRECQKNDWRKGGHKQQCQVMQEKCQTVSKQVVDLMTDPNLLPPQKVVGFKELTGAAMYRAARKHGLDRAIRQLLRQDIANLQDQYRAGLVHGYTWWIMCVLFGCGCYDVDQPESSGGMSRVDGYRCRSFVKSHPEAFSDWFEASVTVVKCFLDREIANNHQVRVKAMRTARDVVVAWSTVLTNDRVAKEILFSLGQDNKSMDAAVKRATWIAKSIKLVFAKLWSAPEGVDEKECVEGHFFQMMAILLLRLEEFKVWKSRAKFLKLVGLRNPRKQSAFFQFSLPVAEHMIQTGRVPTGRETELLLRGRMTSQQH